MLTCLPQSGALGVGRLSNAKCSPIIISTTNKYKTMKPKIILAILAALSFPLNVFAINAPTVDQPPSEINASTYTLVIHTDAGAKVTVTGGKSEIAPVTDGEGDDTFDGIVRVTVGLAQNSVNTFSITVQKNGATSSSVMVTITEDSTGNQGDGDTTAPAVPVLNSIPSAVDTAQYRISGTAEANANIYVRDTTGKTVGSTQANSTGYFQVTVDLEENKTNRFNVSAEDEAGNEGPAIQAVIRQNVDLPEPVVEEEPVLTTSSQIFFGDIEGHWAETYIEQLYTDNVVSGKSEGVFDPNGLITRAELTKIALLAFGYSVNATVDTHPFSDVPRNSWFAPYVEEAKTNGIIEGYPTGGFGPNDFITRAAALKIILGAAKADVSTSVADFSDVPADAWFAKYVGYAQENAIVGGYPDGLFHPEKNITRAEVAKIVVKVLDMK